MGYTSSPGSTPGTPNSPRFLRTDSSTIQHRFGGPPNHGLFGSPTRPQQTFVLGQNPNGHLLPGQLRQPDLLHGQLRQPGDPVMHLQHLQPGETAQLHTLLPAQPVPQLQQIQPDLPVRVQPPREPGECEPREPGECEPGEYVSCLCFTVILQ